VNADYAASEYQRPSVAAKWDLWATGENKFKNCLWWRAKA